MNPNMNPKTMKMKLMIIKLVDKKLKKQTEQVDRKGGHKILNDTKNDTKNSIYINDIQEDTDNTNNIHDTKNQRMKLYVFEANFGNSC